MAEKHEIEVIISPDGKVQVRLRGIRGPSCEKILRKVGEGIGELKEFVKSSEYYEQDRTRTRTIRKLGG